MPKTSRPIFLLGLNVGKIDPSATLFQDGKVLAHVEEERFTRKKKGIGQFPTHAISHCLQVAGLKDVSHLAAITLGFEFDQYAYEVPTYFLKEWQAYPDKPKEALEYELALIKENHPRFVMQRLESELKAANLLQNSSPLPNVHFYHHHQCHAATAHFSSGFERSLGLVADGRSELDTVSVWDCQGRSIRKVMSKTLPHSLGWVYRLFTVFCGFSPHEGEGKLMGLAPYGKPNAGVAKALEKIILWKKDSDGSFDFEIDATYLYLSERLPNDRSLTKKLIDLLGPPCPQGEETSDFHKSVAFEIQDRFEKTLIQFAGKHLKELGHSYLTLSGGVFLNCKANGAIWTASQQESSPVPHLNGIYIFPMSGDDGIGYGSNLLHLARQPDEEIPLELETIYLGPAFSKKEIQREAEEFQIRKNFPKEAQLQALLRSLQLSLPIGELKTKLQASKEMEDDFYRFFRLRANETLNLNLKLQKDIVKTAAQAIAEGKTVAWFQGRMEAGPRALGARSILADPRTIQSRDQVNRKVKFREAWRPFCPSVLDERKEEFFLHPTASPYMINTFQVTEKGLELAPAIVHVDQTARPQFLTKNKNPRFHALITEFDRLTGVPILLNTSMNIKGEPICCTPEDAFQFYFATDIDALAIGEFWIEKSD